MTLAWLNIGWIPWIWDFWWNSVPKPNTGTQQNAPQANITPIPINNTSTPKNVAPNTQFQSIAPTWTFKNQSTPVSTVLDRQIEDLQKKTMSPTIDTSIWFWNLWGFAWINKPLISNWFQNIPVKWTEQTQMTKWTPDVQNKIVEEVKNKQINNEVTKNININNSLKDLTDDMTNVIADWREVDIPKLKQLYPEFNQVDDKVLWELTSDMKNVISEWRTVDMEKLKQLYPELNVSTVTADKVQWESFGDRLFGWVWQWLVWAAKWVKNALWDWGKEFIENSKRIIEDKNKDWREKFNQILLWEWVGWFVWGWIGDIIGWALEWVFKWATTESERKYLSQEAKKVFKEAINVASSNQNVQEATNYIKQKYDSLTQEQKQDLNDLTRYAVDYSNFLVAWDNVPLKWAWEQITNAGKYILEQWGKAFENKAIKWAIEKVVWSEILWELWNIASTIKSDVVTPFAKKTITTAEKQMISDVAKSKPELADQMIEKMHKFTDSEIRKYKEKFGETPGQTLNNKWLIAWGEETLQKSLESMNSYGAQKKQWLAAITTPVPKNADVTQMAQEVADFERAVLTPEQLNTNWGLTQYDTLLEKAKNGELSHIELEKIKSNFERNKNLPYQKSLTKTSEESTRLKNLDSSVRTNQQKRAEEAWFGNIKEINKEISKNKAIADLLAKDVDKVTGLWISDYILLAESVVDPSTLSLFAAKNISKTEWFKKWAIKAANIINWKKTLAEKIIDFKKIQQISDEAWWNSFIKSWNLKQPALPNLWKIWQTPATIVSPWKKIIGWSEWNIIEWNIWELPNKSIFKSPETSGLPKSEGLSNIWKVDNWNFSEPYFSNQKKWIASLSEEKLKQIEIWELNMNKWKYKTTIDADILPIDRKYMLEVEKDVANDMKENWYKTIEERAKSVEKSPINIIIDNNWKIEIIDWNHRAYAAKILWENVNAYVDSSREIIDKFKNKLNIKVNWVSNLKPQAIQQTNPVVTMKTPIESYDNLDLHTRAFNWWPLETDFSKVKIELKNIEKENNIKLQPIRDELNKYTTSMWWDSYNKLINFTNTNEYKIYKKYQDYILRDQPLWKTNIKLYRWTSKWENINNNWLVSRTKNKQTAEKFAKAKWWKVIEKEIPVSNVVYDTEIIWWWSYWESEVLVKQDNWLSNLWKTKNILNTPIYKWVTDLKKINTPWAWQNVSMFSTNENIAKSYSDNVVKVNKLWDYVYKEDVLEIDLKWKKYNDTLSWIWKDKTSKNNIINHYIEEARKQWKKVLVLKWIEDIWPRFIKWETIWDNVILLDKRLIDMIKKDTLN